MRLAQFNHDSRHMRLRGLAVTLTLLGVAQLAGGPHGEWLRYSRMAIEQGQFWRLLTAHLVHYDVAHATLNAAGLILLWLLFVADARPRQWAVVTLVSALSISIGLWYQHPEIEWYLGLSGVLHGLWAAASLSAIVRWRLEALVSGSLLAAKLMFEQHYGALSDPLLGHTLHIVVEAHVYGTLGGLSAALLTWRRPAF